jgi:ATP-dependent protease HslVU (ClpYQ) ATPase subunit
MLNDQTTDEQQMTVSSSDTSREKMRRWLKEGKFDEKIVELEVSEPAAVP